MNQFVLLVRPDGYQLSEDIADSYARTYSCNIGHRQQRHRLGSATVITAVDGSGPIPNVACVGSLHAAGVVRLDNRGELEHRVRRHDNCLDDLTLALHLIAQDGERVIEQLIGDFAFAIWDSQARRVLGVRDAMGAKRLFHSSRNGVVAFASRADILADCSSYDHEVLLTIAAAAGQNPVRTPFANVAAVPAASVVAYQGANDYVRCYWDPNDVGPSRIGQNGEREWVETFRELFGEAVRARMAVDGGTWSQLSGGLDSSSVVGMAEHLHREGVLAQGIQGTISLVFPWSAEGDERVYSDAVAKHWGIRNDVVSEFWHLEPDEIGFPWTDRPDPEQFLYARDRRIVASIRSAGGRVLLTGYGSDQYLAGNMLYFADWLVAGRVREAIREMFRLAIIGRVSFWQLSYLNALVPLLPAALQRRAEPELRVAAWFPVGTLRRFGLDRFKRPCEFAGRRGRKYRDLIGYYVREMPIGMNRHQVIEEQVEIRHPFAHRPLIEHCMRLPPEMLVRPHARKWILRQAMRGILPELVRTRVGKGGITGFTSQSLIRARRTVQSMTRDSCLADLGLIDVGKLRKGIEEALGDGPELMAGTLVYTLAVEMWLRNREGRPTEGVRATPQFHRVIA